MFVLSDYVSMQEDVNTEYKEFCLKTYIYKIYSKNEINEMIRTGKVLGNFNDVILTNIYTYMDIYIGRYTSSFHNSPGEISHLWIGINDYNEITGIPYNGDLRRHTSDIQAYINKELIKNVDHCCHKVSMSIHECIIDKLLIDNSNYNEYEKEYKRYNNEYKAYVVKKKEWIYNIRRYKGKLIDVLKDEKYHNEFSSFMTNIGLTHMIPNINTILIEKDIRMYKTNPNYIIYWIIRFKEDSFAKLLPLKPKPPIVPKILNANFCLFTKLTCLRKRFTMHQMRYFMIHIIYRKHVDCSFQVSYFDKRSKIRRQLTRVYGEDGPSCIDVK